VINFRVLEDSPIHTGKTQQCDKQKQILEKSLSIWIVMHCSHQSRLRMCNFYLKICASRNKICCLKVGILPVKTPFPKMKIR